MSGSFPAVRVDGDEAIAGDHDTDRNDGHEEEAEDGSMNIAMAWVQSKRQTDYASMRHALGVCCLLTTVVLWTASNFLNSAMFADNTYSKPYLVTYINMALFTVPIIPLSIQELYRNPSSIRNIRYIFRSRPSYAPVSHSEGPSIEPEAVKLSFPETARLALQFCVLCFCANYLISACLKHTTVGSSTILTSTSSIWTLFFGALVRIERFTLRKLLGVLACLAGVVLTSHVDYSDQPDKNRGSFPHKTPSELATGNAMALFSAVLYGLYAVMMKKRLGDERRVNMIVFFGMEGVWNVLLLWPGLVVLHLLGVERFEAPPGGTVWAILIMNAVLSLLSDVAWGFAMLLTSPLLVTIGLSLTIPLSLVGQIVLDAHYSSPMYWLGAIVVVLSFLFINREETHETPPSAPTILEPNHDGEG